SPGMDPRIQAGLSLLLAGQVITILAAVIVAAGWFATARTAKGSTTSAAVHAHRTTTAQRLGLLMRLTAVVGVAGVTLWVLLDIAALAGAVVGTVLLLQVLLVLVLLRARMRRSTSWPYCASPARSSAKTSSAPSDLANGAAWPNPSACN